MGHTDGIRGSTKVGASPLAVMSRGHSFTEHYHGLEDIPDRQRVFSMPKVPIREQMTAYQKMANRTSLTAERPTSKADRKER